MDEFDPAINLDYHEKYDNQSNILSSITGGTVAAVADFGASVWNSLPLTPEVSTEDILRKVSSNALRVYEENPDTIQAASFVGGLFVPSGLAFKGLQASRAGVKGVNWFSKAGREADLARIDDLFREGQTATKLYRESRNSYFAKGLANQALDAVAMEAAVLGTMNAHPLMEDYMADPVKNFAIGAAFGGVIGSTVGHIADRFAVKNLVGASETAVYKTIFDEMATAYKSTHNATQVQIQEANINSLTKMINATEGTYDIRTTEVAKQVLLGIQVDQAKTFESMLSPELAKLPTEAKQELMTFFKAVPGMAGVEQVGYLTQKLEGEGNILKAIKSKFSDTATFTKVNPKTNAIEAKEIAYYPEFGRYASNADAKYYSRARDLGKTVEQLDRELGKDFGRIPNTSIYEELLSKNSASIDAQYLSALNRVDSLSVEQIQKLAIAPDDLPMMNAIIARVAKEPDAFENLKLTVTKNQPNYGVVQQEIFKQGGVKANHIEELSKLTGANPKFNMAQDRVLSRDAQKFLSDWVSGGTQDKSRFRAAVDKYLRNGSVADDASQSAIAEIFNSPNRKAFLAELGKHADADGNIYLWRGTHQGKAVGHSAVESYTTSFNVAKGFGRPRLYKVHVDDVIGSITKPSQYEEFEILVGSPTRQTEATLPVQTISNAFAQKANTVQEGLTPAELSNSLISLKEGLVNSMLKQGVPMETIAIRTNTPLDTIQAFAASSEGTSLIEAGIIQEYRNAAEIDNYLNPAKRALSLKSDLNKMSFSQIKAGLDNKTTADMNHEIMSAFLQSSDSTIATRLHGYLFGSDGVNSRKPLLDTLRAQVSNFVNSKAGSKFWSSTDFFVRDMGDAGQIASIIGKDMQHLANDSVNTILKPITQHMEKIVTDPLALTEANTVINLNASLKGFRVYKDRQFWQKVTSLDAAGKEVERLEPVLYKNQEYRIKSDSVDSMLLTMQDQGRELFKLKNVSNKILGKKNINDIGFWVPSFNPKNKFISYVWNQVDDTTKLLWGNTAEELASMERAYASTVPADRLGNTVKIVTKGNQEDYNLLNGRLDPLTMEIANVEMQKTGSSANAIVRANADIFAEIAGGYEHYIGSQIKQLAEISMSDVVDILDRMSTVNQHYFKNQSLSAVGKMINQPRDAANVIKNTLLGNSNLNEYTSWRSANQSFETGLSIGVRTVSKAWDIATKPMRTGLMGSKKELTPDSLAKMDYADLATKLERSGIVNPWKAFDDEAANIFNLAKLTDSKDSSARIIHASNAFAATVALRIGELAQPIVNALSLPILTSLAISNKMPETFMGITKGTAKVSGTQIMYEGARAANDPRFKSLEKMWQDLGYFKPLISEANETLSLARSFDPSVMTKVEKALNSNFVNIMSKPADWSETFVRRQTMFTGAVLAKRLYPELDDVGVTIFARDFMDRAVGNYHAAQRPVFFQGTMGVALGLFQTYMLTMAQNMYRGLEMKNYKAIGKAMLAQTTIFGGSSLPGFHQVSEAIGEHFSDNNVDLTTGTYRALPDKMADFVLYGLPSNLGPALYTRGEINPRLPNVFGGVQNVVGVNFAMQAKDMVTHVASAIGSDHPNIGQALGEALSMQSMSRPLARGAELMTGYATTRQGNTVSTPEEVWTTTGIMSRIISTRPLEEAKLRQAMHLNSYYGSIDREARQGLTNEIKTALRNGTLDDSLVAKVSHEYMRNGGTPTGWRSALRTAIAQSQVNGKANLMSKLDSENPINFMIDNLD